jgi:hypothetical protein
MSEAVGKSYKTLFDECDMQDTFAGQGLPAHAGKPLTCSGDRNRVGFLDKYPDNTIAFSAKAAVDADGSRYACKSSWPNQCNTWLEFDAHSEHKDVNAEDTPFVVVPGKMTSPAIDFQAETGIKPGDLAVAFTGGKCAFGVVGDAGPYFRLGELSLKAQADLGHPRCKVAGQYPCEAIIESGIGSGVNYLIFPHTRPVPLTSQNVNEVAANAAEKRAAAFIAQFTQ